ncbi:MAG: hypothetical protein V1860_03460 [bacterium]
MMFKNWWNSISFPLKGGFIGIFITIIYSAIMYGYIAVYGININGQFYNSFPMVFLMGEYFPSSIIFCLIFYFLLGALVGYIIGKIKAKT